MWAAVVVLLFLYMFIDVNYFLRILWVAIIGYPRKLLFKRSIFEEFSQLGICLTQDIDHMRHMNNAKYFRDADFARSAFWLETCGWDAIKKHGAVAVLGASTIRYRRSLNIFELFYIKTRLLCWDEKAFYLEQRWVRKSDGFIMAVAFMKQTLIGASPPQVIETLVGHPTPSPEPPEHIKHFILCHQISSLELRKDS